MKVIFLIIKSRFKQRKIVNGLVILMIAISVIALNIALALCNGFEKRLLDKIVSFPPQISIASKSLPHFGTLNTTFSKVLNITQGQALVVNTDNQKIQGVVLKGTKLGDIYKLLDKKNILSGKYPLNNEILIGDKLAEKLEVWVGNTLKLITDPSSFMDVKISGIFKIGLYDFDASVAIMPDGNLKALSNNSIFSNFSSFYGIWLKNPYEARNITLKISQMNPSAGVSNWQDDNKTLVNALNFEKTVIFTVLSLLTIAAGASIAVTQIMHILNQKNQIAVLTAIGFTPKKLLGLYMLEGLLLGLFGVITGIITSFIISRYFSVFPVHLPISVYHIENLSVNLQVSDLLAVSIMTMALVIVASIIPAIYAFRLSPVEILRD